MVQLLACSFRGIDGVLLLLMYAWPLTLIVGGATVWTLLASIRDRVRGRSGSKVDARLREGRCVECGYDLRATPSRCPECGTPAPVWVTAGERLPGEDAWEAYLPA
jgi:hypothetical protein